MPVPSAISQLPPDLVEELDRRLFERGFSSYEALVEWLGGRGHKIAPSQISRHAQGLKASALRAREKALQLAELSKLIFRNKLRD